MAITPNPPGTINTPNSPTAESAGAVQAPNDPTAQAAVAINTPNSPTAESAGTINTPNSPTAESAGAIQAPNDPTALGAGVIPRTLVPTLNLNFASGLYAQNGTPKTQDELITFTRGSTGTFLNRQKDANNDWQYFVDSASNDELRFEYDAATGESLGALIEGGSSNLLTRSEEFDHTDWTKTDSTIAVDDTAAPDLTMSADKLEASITGSIKTQVFQAITTTSDTPYTISAYVKRSEASFIQILFDTIHVDNDPRVNFDLSTGTIGAQDVDIDAAAITPVGNDWFRISATVTTAGTALTTYFMLAKSANDIRNQSNSWTAGEGLYIRGAQVEQQEAPTSYIKTTTAPVARAADLASTPTAGSMPSGDVTFFADVRASGINTNGVLVYDVESDSGSIDTVFSNTGDLRTQHGGALLELGTGFSPPAFDIALTSVLNKSLNTIAGYIDGVQAATGDAGAPSTANPGGVIGIGNASPLAGNQIFGHIKKLKIYDKALTAQEVALL